MIGYKCRPLRPEIMRRGFRPLRYNELTVNVNSGRTMSSHSELMQTCAVHCMAAIHSECNGSDSQLFPEGLHENNARSMRAWMALLSSGSDQFTCGGRRWWRRSNSQRRRRWEEGNGCRGRWLNHGRIVRLACGAVHGNLELQVREADRTALSISARERDLILVSEGIIAFVGVREGVDGARICRSSTGLSGITTVWLWKVAFVVVIDEQVQSGWTSAGILHGCCQADKLIGERVCVLK